MRVIDFSEKPFTDPDSAAYGHNSLLEVQGAISELFKTSPDTPPEDTLKSKGALDWINNTAHFIQRAALEAEEALYNSSIDDGNNIKEHKVPNTNKDQQFSNNDILEYKHLLEEICEEGIPKFISERDKLFTFGKVFKCERSIIVYFIPGQEPMAVFINKKKWSNSQRIALKSRIENLNSTLTRKQFRVTKSRFDHLFEFSHAVFSRAIADKSPRSFLIENISKYDSENGSDAQQLETEEQLTHHYDKYIWNVSESISDDFQNETVLVTGIVTTADSFVFQASYFKDNFAEEHLDLAPIKGMDSGGLRDLIYSAMRFLQEGFGREVVARFYAPLVQYNTKTLRRALERTNVSRSFLKEAGDRLDDDEKGFTYCFEYQGKEQNCADLNHIILNDIAGKMETIYETVLDLEKRIYSRLMIDYEKSIKILKPLLEKRDPGTANMWQFPSRMEMSKLVQEVEHAQRALHMKTRDHVIHPFQTFLLGVLIIDSFLREFLIAMGADFGLEEEDIFSKNNESSGLTTKGRALRDFLKTSWFVCATMHDVGYPIEVFDELNSALKKQIAEMLNLDKKLLGTPTKLRIDDVMYDDPRTELVIRRLVAGLFNELEIPDVVIDAFGREVLLKSMHWMIKRYSFVRKDHDLCSTLTLALMFLKNSNPISGTLTAFANDFHETSSDTILTKLTPIEKHILLPVMLHHILEWNTRIRKMAADDYKTNDDDQNMLFKASVATQMLEPLWSLFGGCVVCKELTKTTARGIISFKKFPLVVLLTICDLFQEWGRPGGMAEDGFPSKVTGELNFISSLIPYLKVKLHYKEDGKFSQHQQVRKKDFSDRKQRVENIDYLFHRGALESLWAVFDNDINEVPIELTPKPRWGNIYSLIDLLHKMLERNPHKHPRELAYIVRLFNYYPHKVEGKQDNEYMRSIYRLIENPKESLSNKNISNDPQSKYTGDNEADRPGIDPAKFERTFILSLKTCMSDETEHKLPIWEVKDATKQAIRAKGVSEGRTKEQSRWNTLWREPLLSQRYSAYILPALSEDVLNEIAQDNQLMPYKQGLIDTLQQYSDGVGKHRKFLDHNAPTWFVPDTVLALIETGLSVRKGDVKNSLLEKALRGALKDIIYKNGIGYSFDDDSLGLGKQRPTQDATAMQFVAMVKVNPEKKTNEWKRKLKGMRRYLSYEAAQLNWRKRPDPLLRSACRLIWACSFDAKSITDVSEEYKLLLSIIKSIKDDWTKWLGGQSGMRAIVIFESLYLLTVAYENYKEHFAKNGNSLP